MCKEAYPASQYRRVVKSIAAAGLVAVLAGCSTASDRFGPFGDNQANRDPGHPTNSGGQIYTGSTGQPSSDNTVYSNQVTTQPLGSPAQSTATYQPTNYRPANGEVQVNPGDTLYSISRKHGVSVGDMIAINNLQPPYNIQAGQRLRLPAGSNAAASTYTASTTPQRTPTATANPATHRVSSGETMYSISRSYGHRPQTVAAYNNIGAPYTVKLGQNLRIPPRGWTAAGAPAVPAQVTVQPARAPANQAAVQPVPAVQQAPVSNSTERSDRQVPAAMPARESSRFRWPVVGRVISQFGEKDDGSRNDGINLAVPAGTSVKAAENGVVAYAGNELRGYGNLVLIRHADNWVTAYAHNSELFVRRGDVVSRGQIIAKAGDSGNVTSPQLHFEVRRGAQAVDPLQYLASDTVAGN